MAEVDEDLGVWIRSVALTDEEAIHDALFDLGVTQLEHLQDLTEDDIGRLPIVKIIEKRRFLRLWKQLKEQNWTLNEPNKCHITPEVNSNRRVDESPQIGVQFSSNNGQSSSQRSNGMICMCTRRSAFDAGNTVQERQTGAVACWSQGGPHVTNVSGCSKASEVVDKMPCGHACLACEASTQRGPADQLSHVDIKKKKAEYMRTYRRKLKTDPSRKHVLEHILSHDRKRQKLRRDSLKKLSSAQSQESRAHGEQSPTPLLASTEPLEDFQQGSNESIEGDNGGQIQSAQNSKTIKAGVSISSPEILSIKEKLKRSSKLFAMMNENSNCNDTSVTQVQQVSSKTGPCVLPIQTAQSAEFHKEGTDRTTSMGSPEVGSSQPSDGPIIQTNHHALVPVNGHTKNDTVVEIIAEASQSSDGSSLDVPTGVFEGIFGNNLFPSDIELTWCSRVSPAHDGYLCHYGVKLNWSVTTDLGINNVQSTPENNIICSTRSGLRMLSSEGSPMKMPFESNAISIKGKGVAVNKYSGTVAYIPEAKTVSIKTMQNGVWTTVNRHERDEVRYIEFKGADEILVFQKKRNKTFVRHLQINTWTEFSRIERTEYYFSGIFVVLKINDIDHICHVSYHPARLMVYTNDFNQYVSNFPKDIYIAKIKRIQWACTDNNGHIFLLHKIYKNDDDHITIWSEDGEYKGHVMEFQQSKRPKTIHSLDKTTLLITFDQIDQILAIDLECLLNLPNDEQLLLNSLFPDL